MPGILRGLAGNRKFQFDVERVVFAMALQRLCCPGSDLRGWPSPDDEDEVRLRRAPPMGGRPSLRGVGGAAPYPASGRAEAPRPFEPGGNYPDAVGGPSLAERPPEAATGLHCGDHADQAFVDFVLLGDFLGPLGDSPSKHMTTQASPSLSWTGGGLHGIAAGAEPLSRQRQRT